MSSFKKSKLDQMSLHPSLVWSLSACAEARGMQELWSKIRPELSSQLKESAIIQSAESSNRIEGVEIASGRLKPLLSGKSKPQDRSEEEVFGYRKALDFLFTKKFEINSQFIQKLHKISQSGLIGDAGQWKSKDNEIIEFLNNGEKKTRFKCVSAKQTPKAIQRLCDDYNIHIQQRKIPELLVIANFVFDFLCIHPFRDGNGRVSRLLTTACLIQLNYQVVRYISLEKIIEYSKRDYYDVLGKSSSAWEKSDHDLFPWWSFFLSVLKTGYQEMKDKVELMPHTAGPKTDQIEYLILDQAGEFQISDIVHLVPHLDREIIKKTFLKMKKNKKIKKIGAGRSTRWALIN